MTPMTSEAPEIPESLAAVLQRVSSALDGLMRLHAAGDADPSASEQALTSWILEVRQAAQGLKACGQASLGRVLDGCAAACERLQAVPALHGHEALEAIERALAAVLQHAEHPQQQPDDGHSEQRAAADKQPAAQVHRLSCLRLRYRVEVSIPSVLAAMSRVLLLAKGLSNEELLGEVNQAAFQSNQRLAAVLENAQRQGWIRNDVTPLTLAVWVRSQVIGRFLLEVDSKRYDGEEWTRLALSSIESTLLSGVDRPGKGR